MTIAHMSWSLKSKDEDIFEALLVIPIRSSVKLVVVVARMMVCQVFYVLLVITSCTKVVWCRSAEHREHGHYDQDGKHSDEHDHKIFLGDEQQKEFKELTQEESLKRLGQISDKIDKNSDGNITAEELGAWVKYISLKEPTDTGKKDYVSIFKDKLTDDGLISWQEYLDVNFPGEHQHAESEQGRIANQRKKFILADLNKDDKLSEDEFVAFRYPHLFDHMNTFVIDGLLLDLDENKDGKVTLEDRLAANKQGYSKESVKKDFDFRDKNKNGYLEHEEVKEWYYPTDYDVNVNEARHLIKRADIDKNDVLTKDEILKNFDVFVGSRATHWGKTLERQIDEL